MKQQWRQISGHSGYEVSNHGRVRSFRQLDSNGDPRILKPVPRAKGHLQVSLRGKWCAIHILVLEAFVGPRPEGLLGLHRDDDKTHNYVGNLYWGTYSDNAYDAVRNGTHPMASKTTCKFGHPLELRPNGKKRWCRICNNASSRESKRRSYTPTGRHPTSEQIDAIRRDPRAARIVGAEYGFSHTTIIRVRKE